jgi:hypothetical protein
MGNDDLIRLRHMLESVQEAMQFTVRKRVVVAQCLRVPRGMRRDP